jgi:hypothetical protein
LRGKTVGFDNAHKVEHNENKKKKMNINITPEFDDCFASLCGCRQKGRLYWCPSTNCHDCVFDVDAWKRNIRGSSNIRDDGVFGYTGLFRFWASFLEIKLERLTEKSKKCKNGLIFDYHQWLGCPWKKSLEKPYFDHGSKPTWYIPK